MGKTMEEVKRRQAKSSKDANNHRYAIVYLGKKNDYTVIRMDTQTGKTWKLIANVWVPVVEAKNGMG